jgi:hypothetical protein
MDEIMDGAFEELKTKLYEKDKRIAELEASIKDNGGYEDLIRGLKYRICSLEGQLEAKERATVDELSKMLRKFMFDYKLNYTFCSEDLSDNLPLVDALSQPHAKDISSGKAEIEEMVDELTFVIAKRFNLEAQRLEPLDRDYVDGYFDSWISHRLPDLLKSDHEFLRNDLVHCICTTFGKPAVISREFLRDICESLLSAPDTRVELLDEAIDAIIAEVEK